MINPGIYTGFTLCKGPARRTVKIKFLSAVATG